MRKLNYLLAMLALCVLWGCSEDDTNNTSVDEQNHNYYCPDANHPHAIDLGLPSGTRWACCNVGASSPLESGIYVAWGETSTKECYDLNTYLYRNDEFDVENIGSDIAGTQYDVAYVEWGESWCMPSHEQQLELLYHCTSIKINMGGVYGMEFTGPNGQSIFMPNAGMYFDDKLEELGVWGHYWSSTQSPYDNQHVYHIDFSDSRYEDEQFTTTKIYGQSVRPVVKSTNIQQP
ncbi:MAG: hypothetical protein IJ155_09395 [Prevotella sp.]|nr:hypothetical protein [Prevotella sp.]